MMRNANPLPFMPEEIIYAILFRLPVDSLVQCKLVCRTWKAIVDEAIVDDPTSIGSYTDRHMTRFILSRPIHWSDQMPSLRIGAYNDETSCFEECKKSINCHLYKPANVSGTLCDVVGSCNGLVCFCMTYYDAPTYNAILDITVVNPLTSEYVVIPRCSSKDGRYNVEDVVYGFGFEPCRKEYKIFAAFCEQDGIVDVLVYTLGSGGWRHPYSNQEPLDGRLSQILTYSDRGMLADGALHWIKDWNKDLPMIISFDLAKEEFQILPLPIPKWEYYCILGVLEGCLSVKFQSHENPEIQEIWIKKCQKQEWIKQAGTITLDDFFLQAGSRRKIFELVRCDPETTKFRKMKSFILSQGEN